MDFLYLINGVAVTRIDVGVHLTRMYGGNPEENVRRIEQSAFDYYAMTGANDFIDPSCGVEIIRRW